MTREVLLYALGVMAALLVLIAWVFLSQRKLPAAGYVFWALVALALPVLGPVLVIALQPGEKKDLLKESRKDGRKIG